MGQPRQDSSFDKALSWEIGIPRGCLLFFILFSMVLGGGCLALLGGGAAVTVPAVERANERAKEQQQPYSAEPVTTETVSADQELVAQSPDPIVYVVEGHTRYHSANCRWVRYAEGQAISVPLSEAVANGYASCYACRLDIEA